MENRMNGEREGEREIKDRREKKREIRFSASFVSIHRFLPPCYFYYTIDIRLRLIGSPLALIREIHARLRCCTIFIYCSGNNFCSVLFWTYLELVTRSWHRRIALSYAFEILIFQNFQHVRRFTDSRCQDRIQMFLPKYRSIGASRENTVFSNIFQRENSLAQIGPENFCSRSKILQRSSWSEQVHTANISRGQPCKNSRKTTVNGYGHRYFTATFRCGSGDIASFSQERENT